MEGNAWTGGTDNLMQATLAAADDDYCDSSSGGNALEPQSAALTFSADATDNKVCSHHLPKHLHSGCTIRRCRHMFLVCFAWCTWSLRLDSNRHAADVT